MSTTNTSSTADSGMSPSIKTLIEVYNKYLIDLLLVAKRRAPGLKKALKESGHSAIDSSSAAHVSHASACLPLEILMTIDPAESVKDDKVLSFEPLKGVPFSAISVLSETEGEKDSIDLPTFLYTLATLATTYSVAASTGEEGARSILVKGVLGRLSRLQMHEDSEDGDNKVVLDDDVATLLGKLAIAIEDSNVAASAAAGGTEGAGGANPLEGFMKSLEKSKIAGMASEISQELDLSKLGANPIEAMGFDKLGDGNSILGDIVSKVGSKIQGKLASGELKQEELLSEAVGFLKAFEGFGGASGGAGGAAGVPDLSGLAGILGSLGGLGGGKKGKGFDASGMMSTMMNAMKASAAAGAHVPRAPTADAVGANERRERMKAKLASKKSDANIME